MNNKQLFFDFGKKVLSHLHLLPDQEPRNHTSKPRASKRKSTKRDPQLETLCHRLLDKAGCSSLRIHVVWNSRLRSTAGSACWRKKVLSLNPALRDISQYEIHRTLLHELAHFLARSRAGHRRIAPHGPEWKTACADLGIPREPRCHNLPLPRIKHTPKLFYLCPHCGQRLARVRPPKHPIACLACCKKFNHGHYHERFRFVRVTAAGHAAA